MTRFGQGLLTLFVWTPVLLGNVGQDTISGTRTDRAQFSDTAVWWSFLSWGSLLFWYPKGVDTVISRFPGIAWLDLTYQRQLGEVDRTDARLSHPFL